MPTYTFKHENTGKVVDRKWTYEEYDNMKDSMIEEGWVRVLVPVAVKDSGSGR